MGGMRKSAKSTHTPKDLQDSTPRDLRDSVNFAMSTTIISYATYDPSKARRSNQHTGQNREILQPTMQPAIKAFLEGKK
jgi:hypothetical protein